MGVKRIAKRHKADTPTDTGADAATDAVTQVVVRLPADCRLGAQAALKAQLEKVMHQGEIVIDAAALERVDTAALQLLVLFKRELEQHGGKLAWCGTNQVLADATAVLGLENLLNLPATTLA